MGRSNIPASGRVFKHSMIFLGKQTPHVHTARWVWWRTWVLYISSAWIPLSYVYISQISRQDTPKQRKLDSLQSKSKGATNETPTCEVTLYAPQTNALCQWWGVRELSSAGELGCWRRWHPGSLCRLVKGWDQRVRCCLKWALYAPKQTHALRTLHKKPKTHVFAKKKSVVGCGYVGGGSKVLSGIGC